MTIPLVIPSSNNGQAWLNATNQTVNAVSQLTGGSLTINNNIIFTNTNVDIILQGSMIANNITINPDSNNLMLQTSNAIINGSMFITGQNTSLFVSNSTQFLNNVTVTTFPNPNITNLLNVIAPTVNVTNTITTNNLIISNQLYTTNGFITTQNTTLGNVTISNSNNTIGNIAGETILTTGNLNTTGLLTIGNNLTVNGNVNVVSSITIGNIAQVNGLSITIGNGLTTSNITGGTYIGNPFFANGATTITQSTNDNSANIATTAFVSPSLYNTGRNLLHNGQLNILQRGFGSWSSNNAYTADRWVITTNGDSYTASIKGTTTGGERGQQGLEIENLFSIQPTTTSGGYLYLSQWIENVKRISGQQVTLSFWAKNAGANTPTLGIGYTQNFGTGGSPSVVGNAGTIGPISARMNRYSITWNMPSAIGKTINEINDATQIMIFLSNGANLTQGGAIGQAASGLSIELGLFQLEIGGIATPFELKTLQEDMELCQRFYLGNYTFGMHCLENGVNLDNHVNPIMFPVTMRATPTSNLSVTGANFATLTLNGTQPGYFSPSPYGFQFTVTATGRPNVGIIGYGAFSADF